MRHPGSLATAIAAATALICAAPAPCAEPRDEIQERRDGAADIFWRAPPGAEATVRVRLLGINDLHGHLESRLRAQGPNGSRPVGGAAVLAAYLAAERETQPRRTLTLIAGDSVGASPAVSGLLRDEPTVAVLNELAGSDCPLIGRDYPSHPAPVATRCRIIATLGNHEFDRGTAELMRLLLGADRTDPKAPGADWGGTRVPVVVANVARRADQQPLLPASALVDLDGIRIGIVGAVTAETPALVVPDRIRDVDFLPEAAAVNAAVAALRERGVRAIVLVIHEGLTAPLNPEPAPLGTGELRGRLASILAGLDGGVDVVIAGHTHRPNNVLVALKDGSVALVTQARAYGTAFSEIDLTLDVRTGAVVAKSARIVSTWGDEGPGRAPAKPIARLVAKAAERTAARRGELVGSAAAAIGRGEPGDPESPLCNLVADAEREVAGTDLAFVNPAGLRADLDAGPITFGVLYDVLPFGNSLVRLTLSGQQVLRLLEQQWSGRYERRPRFLCVAGMRYVYDLGRPPGQRILAADDARGESLDGTRRYSVVANDFLAGGGDYYSVLAEAGPGEAFGTDVAVLEQYLRRVPGPVRAATDGRARPFAAHATAPLSAR